MPGTVESTERSISAQAVQCVAEIELRDHVTIRHSFDKASRGVDCCFRGSRCPDSQLDRTEIGCKLVGGVAVGTFGGNATQSIADRNGAYSAGFLLQCNQVATKKHQTHLQMNVALQQVVDEAGQC